MLKLAWRNTLRHRVRTALTLSVIISGVVGIILSGGFVEDVYIQLREATIHSQLGHIQVYRTGYREYGSANPYKYLIEDPAAILKRAQGTPNVEAVMARLSFTGLINNGRTDVAILGEGIEPDKEARLGSLVTITAGRQLTGADRFGILLGEGIFCTLPK